MIIAVKNKNGEVFTNDMIEDNHNKILEIHFCTSYTQVVVQRIETDDDGNTLYLTEDIIIPAENADEWSQAIDFIAVGGDEEGKWAERV